MTVVHIVCQLWPLLSNTIKSTKTLMFINNMFPCFSKYLSKSVKKRGAFEFLKQGSKVNDFTNVHIYTFTRGPGILGTNE